MNISMNQNESNYDSGQNHANPTIQYKRKRRARDQATQRNYVCACGKTYLSYPALYTHIKNKHQGKAPNPEDISIIQPTSTTRSMMVTRQQPQNQYEKHISTPQQALVYVINTFRPYSTTKQLNYTIQQIFSPFPSDIRKQLEQAVHRCFEEKIQVEKILDNGIKAVTIDSIMARFISLLVHKIDKNIIIQFIFVLLMFRMNLNEHFPKHQTVSITSSSVEYTKASSGMKMLQNINDFNLYYFDILAEKYRYLIQQPYFIGRKNREYICLAKFMFLFGRWIFLDRYTNFKIKLNNF